jgi:hypothetical protein
VYVHSGNMDSTTAAVRMYTAKLDQCLYKSTMYTQVCTVCIYISGYCVCTSLLCTDIDQAWYTIEVLLIITYITQVTETL